MKRREEKELNIASWKLPDITAASSLLFASVLHFRLGQVKQIADSAHFQRATLDASLSKIAGKVAGKEDKDEQDPAASFWIHNRTFLS